MTSADLEKECTEIGIHTKELSFISASFVVAGKDGTTVEAEEIRDNKKATTVTFASPEAIPASSTITRTIKYVRFVNNQMTGFYRSSYTNTHGATIKHSRIS